mmetsp:Transcript_22058/g.59501  ORF Transcript_22058/g.59501 Transcript_22058/m.59501 type:complete len:212 (+) Transcript_22058:215-850(+)
MVGREYCMMLPIVFKELAGMSTAFVLRPWANSFKVLMYCSATRYSDALTPCCAVASRRRLTAPDSALASMSFASASPFARLMRLVRMPSACSTSFAASPWLRTIALSRFPSAWSTMDRRSRSAMICASMVVLISCGGIMLFTSTRVMVTPQRSASRMMVWRSSSLTRSREEKVSSRLSWATMLRSVDWVSNSMASGRFWILKTARRGSDTW